MSIYAELSEYISRKAVKQTTVMELQKAYTDLSMLQTNSLDWEQGSLGKMKKDEEHTEWIFRELDEVGFICRCYTELRKYRDENRWIEKSFEWSPISVELGRANIAPGNWQWREGRSDTSQSEVFNDKTFEED